MTTVYRSDDTGAPVLTMQLNKFSDLLQAVLVDGYGSKSGAGWTSTFSATGKKVFSNGSTYFRVDDSTTFGGKYGVAHIALYETMTDIDTGTGEAPSGGLHASYGTISSSSKTYTTNWVIVADDKTVYIWIDFYSSGATGGTWFSSTDAQAHNTYGINAIIVGEYDTFMNSDGFPNIISIANYELNATPPPSNRLNAGINYYIARGADRTTIGQRVYIYNNELFGTDYAGTSGSYNTAIDKTLSLDYSADFHSQYYYSPLYITETISGNDQVVRGKLRGLLVGPYINKTLQGADMDYTGKTITVDAKTLLGITLKAPDGYWIDTGAW